jgi:hypothetical protein
MLPASTTSLVLWLKEGLPAVPAGGRCYLEGVMNFGSGALAFGHGESKTIPKRCFRRRVGVRRTLPGSGERGRAPAQPRP